MFHFVLLTVEECVNFKCLDLPIIRTCMHEHAHLHCHDCRGRRGATEGHVDSEICHPSAIITAVVWSCSRTRADNERGTATAEREGRQARAAATRQMPCHAMQAPCLSRQPHMTKPHLPSPPHYTSLSHLSPPHLNIPSNTTSLFLSSRPCLACRT